MKKRFLLVLAAILVASLLPIWPAQAAPDGKKDCRSGCKFIASKDRGDKPLCSDGCYDEEDESRCCSSVTEVVSELTTGQGVGVPSDCFVVTASGLDREGLSNLYWLRDNVLTLTIRDRQYKAAVLFLYYEPVNAGFKLAPVVEEYPWLAAVVKAASGFAAKTIAAAR